MAFEPLPAVPDHSALEQEILAWWEREGIFDKLREQNRGAERYSFLDGPITANNPMGVHHAWGRTLKDVFQRYKALRGFDQRYQNGFDCQGLWVEVEVEKALGLNSKRDIEEYGLAEFAERCKERVAHYSEVITDQDRRLGRWMDWDNDYYTFSDTNISYIWGFLKAVHERGWLYKGHRSTRVVPALRDVALPARAVRRGEYKELEHPSLYVRFPLEGARRRGDDRLDDDAVDAAGERRRRRQARRGVRAPRDGGWVAARGVPDEQATSTVAAARSSSASNTRARSTICRPRKESRTGSSRGTRSRWTRAPASSTSRPAAGAEDFELSRVHGLPVLAPIDESGRMLPGYGALRGLLDGRGRGPRHRGPPPSVSCSSRPGRITHRYPTCWRCGTPLVFRVVDDWFIACDEIRQPMLDANADGRVDAVLLLEADGRLAAEHGRLEHLAQALLRAAAADLSVRLRRAERDRLAGRARRARDRAASTSFRSSTGPGSTR